MALPRIRIDGQWYDVPTQEPARTACLYFLLQRLVAANLRQFRTGEARLVPVVRVARYQREPRGREHWQTAAELQRSKRGDCEDLASYEAARLQLAGIRSAMPELETTPIGWHVVTRLNRKQMWDPSLACGMGRDDER